VIFAVAAAVALAMPSRVAPPPPRDLHALAQRELTIPGRYQLTSSPTTAPPESLWSRARSWLYARWLQLMHALFARVHVGDRTVMSLGDGLLVLVGLLLLVVAIRLLRKHMSRSRRRSIRKRSIMMRAARRAPVTTAARHCCSLRRPSCCSIGGARWKGAAAPRSATYGAHCAPTTRP
jgi:hypothetical protein